jgi:glutamate dehydrogenase/leucine dehydrogenase
VAKVVACDVDPDLVGRRERELAGANLEARAVDLGDTSLFEADCDIFSPNATGAVLNPVTIPLLRAKIVCGASNNQLEDTDRDDAALAGRGITYVPDFLTNRMGIVNCADEQNGYVRDDPDFERHLGREWAHSIFRMATEVLGEARERGEPTAKVAVRMADRLSMEEHPLAGHRGRRIINSLVADRWHEDARIRKGNDGAV